MTPSGISRRELVRRGGLLSLVPAFLRGATVSAEPAAAAAPAPPAGPGLRPGPEIYQSIGVRPFVNARGTYTILTGSTALPEVRAAMEAASKHYVHLDELELYRVFGAGVLERVPEGWSEGAGERLVALRARGQRLSNV